MSTDFPTDVIWMNTMCTVPLANHLRVVGDAFRPLRFLNSPNLIFQKFGSESNVNKIVSNNHWNLITIISGT